MNCRQCGAALPPGSDFCGECGTRVEEAQPACTGCGTPLAPGDAFCQSCGTPVASASTPRQQAPPPPYQQPPPPPPPGQAFPPSQAPHQAAYGAPPPVVAPPPGPPPSQGQSGGILVPIGYVFSLLGGLLGIAVGGALWQSKEQGPGGQKIPKYGPGTRRHGISMVVLGSLMFAVSLQMKDQVPLFGGGGTVGSSVSTPAAGSAAGEGQAARPAGGGSERAQPSRTSGGGSGAARPAPPAGGGDQPSGGGQSRSLAGLGLSPSTAPANEFEELVLAYLDEAYRGNLEGEGFGAAIHREFGSLDQGESRDVNVVLPATSQVAFFGTCDNECSDFNFMLFSQDGRMVDEDTAADDIPLVLVETGSEATRYTLRVDMASCSMAPCYYAIGVYRR